MIRILLGRHLRHHARLLAALVAGLGLLELLIVAVMARVELGPGLERLLDQFMPPAARELFFSQIGAVTFAGAVAFGFQHPAALVATLAFVVVAGTIPAAERESGFLELVLARPVSRDAYLAAVLLFLIVGAVLLPAALLAGASVGLLVEAVPGELPWTRYALSAAELAGLLLALGGVTLGFAAGSARRGPAVARSVSLILALYVVEVLADLWKPLAVIRWLSPFHYFKPIPAAIAGTVPWVQPVVLVGIFVGGAGWALAWFRRQDL